MGYWIVAAVMAVWVGRDAGPRAQRGEAIAWAAATLVLPFLALPFYLATRPLQAGEARRGGKPWTILKSFAQTWSVLLLATGLSTALEMAATLAAQQTEADRAAYGFAAVLGLMLIAMYWFFPTAGALALGLILRKPSAVEHGPTGPLALGRGAGA